MGKMNNLLAPHREQAGKGPALTRIPFGRHARSLLALCLCLCVTLGLMPVQAAEEAVIPNTKWSDNVNTDWYNNALDADAYTINTAAELAGLAELVNDGTNFQTKTIKLGRDIDLSQHLWTPIGTGSNDFQGTLDGNGKTITGMTVNMVGVGGGMAYVGLFGQSTGGTFQNLILEGVSISLSTAASGQLHVGGLLGSGTAATVSGCKVSGTVSVTVSGGANPSIYAGGIVGATTNTSNTSTISDSVVSDMTVTMSVTGSTGLLFGGIVGMGVGTIQNCIATDLTFDIRNQRETHFVRGIANQQNRGTLTVENCFFSAPNEDIAMVKEGVIVKNSYWQSAASTSGSTLATDCYKVTPYQVAGTAQQTIGGTTYANTTSLTEALNKWATEKGKGEWALYEGAPILKALMPPVFIDIKDGTDQDQNSTTESLDADVTLHGQVQENVSLLSVTLPATIPFIIDVDSTGMLERVLSATATLANRSDTGVKVELTNVSDDKNKSLLTKANLFLVPDPVPGQGAAQITLVEGEVKPAALLANLTAPADKATPTTATVKVDGKAKTPPDSIGTEGEVFILDLTFKVTKT